MTNAAASSNALAVEYRTVGSLKPDPRNARTHPKRQLEQIKASIEEFGFINPILIDEQSVIIAGHGRLRAAKELGRDKVPTIVLAGLNRCAEARTEIGRQQDCARGQAGTSISSKLELGDLSKMNFDLSLTGFSMGRDRYCTLSSARTIRTTSIFRR